MSIKRKAQLETLGRSGRHRPRTAHKRARDRRADRREPSGFHLDSISCRPVRAAPIDTACVDVAAAPARCGRSRARVAAATAQIESPARHIFRCSARRRRRFNSSMPRRGWMHRAGHVRGPSGSAHRFDAGRAQGAGRPGAMRYTMSKCRLSQCRLTAIKRMEDNLAALHRSSREASRVCRRDSHAKARAGRTRYKRGWSRISRLRPRRPPPAPQCPASAS